MKLSKTNNDWKEVLDLDNKEIKGFNIKNCIDENIENIKNKSSENIVCNEVILKPGVQDIYHFHNFAYDIFRVQSGTLTVIINGKKITINPGGWIIAEPGENHCIANKSDKDVALQEIRLFVTENDKFSI